VRGKENSIRNLQKRGDVVESEGEQIMKIIEIDPNISFCKY